LYLEDGVSILLRNIGKYLLTYIVSYSRRCDDWNTGVLFKAMQDFSLLHSVQTDSDAHTASYPVGTGTFSPGGEADHSPPFNADVKKI
jgi:hypothetical protein